MNIEISIEFFPPQTPEGVEKLRIVRSKLAVLKPEFFSVTFGAGGSTRERTFSVVKEIAAEGFNAAPHLSCVGSTRAPAGRDAHVGRRGARHGARIGRAVARRDGRAVATQASPGGRHLAFDPSSRVYAGSDGTSGPARLAAAVARYLATVTHPDDRPLRPGQRWLLMLDGGYPSYVTVSPDGREFLHGGNRRVPVENWPPGTRRYLSEGVAS